MERAGDQDLVAFDLPFHLRVVTEDQSFAGDDGAVDNGVDAESAGDFELPFELDAAIEKAGPIAGFFQDRL